MDAHTRTKFQRFMNDHPLSFFKKLIISTLGLLHNLNMMSLAKAVLGSLKDCECKRITLSKCPLVPYVPKKDVVQEMVSVLKNDQVLKTQIGEDAELCLSIWHSTTREGCLTHVGSAMDTMSCPWKEPLWIWRISTKNRVP
jgi:hypothetical protein